MSKLTDSQLVILSAASQRDSGAVLPLPKSLKLTKPAATTLLAGLLKRDLVAEAPAKPGSDGWRNAKNGQRITLVLTDAGSKAIGVDDHKPSRFAPADAKTRKQPGHASGSAVRWPASKTAPAAMRKGTKLALLADLLSRKDGATIADAVKATGWQAHSVRGAISGALKKKLGLAVASEAIEGRGRVYRIAVR